ncbi:RNA polymerase sigma factor SigJ [Ornithinimicrobium faecis]|uniref:RNA polymerase sigma factor SigJ n=1 Tax=Ornithinimicrobium faecis TaxID=2934158 RepID=UPI002117715E|nr:RNA polymerase sigma factor SigJ [Ornithinimicrobium sp. HY1745]
MAETTFWRQGPTVVRQAGAQLMDAQRFEELRPLLFSISYRILGSVGEAEDAVQETWLRYAGTDTEPESLKAYLSTVVSRISIDVLRSARVRREAYVGPWFPEPLPTDTLQTQPYAEPADSAELADSVSMAALLLLERLSPLERAVFVLREVFDFGFAEIAETIERSEPAARQLAARARRHMRDGRPRFEVDRRKRLDLADRFFDALREGNLEGLQGLLAADVETVNDAGGKGGGEGGRFGAERAARILVATVPPLLASGASLEPREFNGWPGAILRDSEGKVVGTWVLDILDGHIQAIRSITNPDKLSHLGPTGDVRAMTAERSRWRRRAREATEQEDD